MREEAKYWWDQAIHDLEAAKKNLDGGVYFLAAFSAHQAAQKALKAAIIELGKTMPPRMHNLLELKERLEETAKLQASEILDDLRELIPHYFTSRYPDAAGGTPAEIYDKNIAERCIKSAERVVRWLKTLMKV